MKDEAREAGHQRAASRPTPGIGHNISPEEARREIAADLAELGNDFLAVVRYLWPWGQEGSGLEGEEGPDVWQAEQLVEIGKSLDADPYRIVREATASGHGIGKSALVAWMVIVLLVTYPDSRGRVTANTDTQLRGTTWGEVSKWFELLNPVLKEQFTYTATAIYSNSPGHEKTWRVDAVPWSKHNPAAFAGLHNAGKRVFIIMDEASEIADVIWDTVEGATTDADTEIVLLVYGNPTQPTGRFKEVVAGQLQRSQGWKPRQIDSRTVKRTNKATLARQIRAWGEDSDFARIRIKGQFPRVGMNQLIPVDLVEAARKRPALYNASDPLILGVDVARFGDDECVFAPRRGNDAKTIPWQRYQGQNTMFLAAEIALFHQLHGCDAIMIDVGGVGAGVYDRVLQLLEAQLDRVSVYPVDFGGAGGWVDYKGTKIAVANKRAAMYASALEHLRVGAALPGMEDREVGDRLQADLTEVQYGFAKQTQILLEPKEMMKKRLGRSPDYGDAYVCTFAYPVVGRITPRTHAPDHDRLLRPEIGVSSQGWDGYDPRADADRD